MASGTKRDTLDQMQEKKTSSARICFLGFVHIIVPMVLGAFVYVCFRQKDLFGISSLAFPSLFPGQTLPYWVLFNLPDALWAYSLTSFIMILWMSITGRVSQLWFIVGVCVAICFELGQYFQIIEGTFDQLDLVWILAACIISWVVFNRKKLGGSQNEKNYR